MKAQAGYKRNYHARLRKQRKFINVDDYVYLRFEHKNADDHRNKLASVAKGSFCFPKVDENTVMIERTDLYVEKVSRSSVILAPNPKDRRRVDDNSRALEGRRRIDRTSKEGRD